MRPNQSSTTPRRLPALRLLLPVAVVPCPPSPPASSTVASTLLNPVPLGDRATHGWTRPGPLSTPVGRASLETPCSAGSRRRTPPLSPFAPAREVEDEPAGGPRSSVAQPPGHAGKWRRVRPLSRPRGEGALRVGAFDVASVTPCGHSAGPAHGLSAAPCA